MFVKYSHGVTCATEAHMKVSNSSPQYGLNTGQGRWQAATQWAISDKKKITE